MIGTPGFIGARLAQAREARGLTAVSLAEMIGVKSANISQYEHGKQTPSSEVMDRIVQVLNRPKAFFLRRDTEHQREGIWYRSMSTATKIARTKAEARFMWLKEIVDYLYQYLDFPALSIPDFKLPDDPTKISMEVIEEIAIECRRFWNLEENPIADVVLLLENSGIIVSRGELGTETLDSFSQWADADFPYVFLGSDRISAVRSRFDAAHELGHLFLHRHIDHRQIRNNVVHRQMENQCHRFSLAFLLPARSFAAELWAPTLNGFYTLKDRWKVSIAGMIKRCEQLGILSEEQVKRSWINLSRRGWRKKEPLDDVLPVEIPHLLSRSVELLVDSGVKTRDQILVDLASSAEDLGDLACLPPGYMSGKQSNVIIMPKVRAN